MSSAPRGEGQAISPVGDTAGPAFGGASVGEPSREQVLLHLHGIGKSYSGVWVLRDVGFSLAAGEVLMLVGENGAGKSTLKNILCGLVAPDAGTIRFRNEPHLRMSTAEASALGIGAIHQELSLFPNLSVAENVFIDALPMRHGLVDVGEMRSACGRLLNDLFGPGIDPGETLDHLSLGERQLVEIAKAVRRASTLLILDEPTASLSIPERQRLFDVVRRLKGRNYGVIYITHFLEEVYALGDQIVVLRDGAMVGSGTPARIDRPELERLMVGRELAAMDARLASTHTVAPDAQGPREVVLRVSDLTDQELLREVSFELHAGEILGLAGLMGAGRTEIAHAIFGLRPATGEVAVAGTPFEHRTPETAKARGLALVSEDRREDQAFLGRTVRENLTATLLALLEVTPIGVLDLARQRTMAAELVQTYGVRLPSLEAPMVALSGGNQQKAILARWLAQRPAVCILDEPTKGIDVGAKADVHRLVAELAAKGMGVLLISSDMEELLALSNRILVMHKGHISGELQPSAFDPTVILRMASTGSAA